ncbi:MAG: prephenate dehydrogenase [Clostridia bacterium]|nr:prephenate dehydrogenase [Clostridia bacterium]
MNIAVVGLGLIGGSVCKALKQKTSHTVFGIDINDIIKQNALKLEAVDYVIEPDKLVNIDIIFLCLYPMESVKFIKDNIAFLKKACIVTDVCGIKTYIENELDLFLKQNGCYYVGGHPMAGKETSGFFNSNASLLQGASYILTVSPHTDSAAFNKINDIIKILGCSVIVTDSNAHDKIIAYTSQLAHIVSSSYVKSPTVQFEKGFTGGSFQDMTRVALLNENMWADLFLLNKDNITREIDNLTEKLKEFKNAICDGDKKRLAVLLSEGKKIKQKHL